MGRTAHAAAIFLTVLLVLCSPRSEAATRHTSIVLLGGTGDLARKYLWQAFFDAYLRREGGEEGEWKLSLAACGTSHASVAASRLKDIFDNHVKCTDSYGSESVCLAKKGEFFDKIDYFQLLSSDDYKTMCDSLATSLAKEKNGVVKEVVLYLAVPPAGFLSALRHFKSQCTFSGQKVFFKVVLEKPQGHDRESAESLSQELLDLFEEDELFRTDHYLAKSIVTCILPFRAANPQLEKMLNRDYVERVEIFIKETVGVEERHSLYNELGVLRDVFQNHLSQLMTLVTLDLPTNLSTSALSSSAAIEQAKVQVLKQVNRVSPSSVVLGQYASYLFDAAREVPDSNVSALVPTFAAALLKVRSPRWLDVPFLLVSGKKMDERASYIRVVFKDTGVCVSNCDHNGHHPPNTPLHVSSSSPHPHDESSAHHHHGHHMYHLPRNAKQQIVFLIGHGASKLPLISVSKSLGEPQLPAVLEEMHNSDAFTPTHSYHGDHPENFYHATPARKVDAYATLLEDLLHDRRQNFVTTPQVLLAWKIWDGVLGFGFSSPPRLYDAGDPASVLNIVVKGNSLEFATADEKQDGGGRGREAEEPSSIHHLHQAQTPATFLGHRMVSGSKEGLAVQLAREIEQVAAGEIAAKGVFHVAFSGGSTPILLWQALAQSFASEYWAHVHVWQVDERCVRAAADSNSNLFQLDRQLLRFIAVPWSHVHAMPVDVAGRLCDPELQGDRQYADSLRHLVPNLQLDYVVLGVGMDGHTASLFPHSPALSADHDTLVTVTDRGPRETPLRMTLTLPLINRAKRVAVLVTGEEKQEILEKLEDSGRGEVGIVDTYPILGVRPVNGTLSWFVDYLAYFGHDYFDFGHE